MKKFLLLTSLMSTNAFAAPTQYIGLSSHGFSWTQEKTKQKTESDSTKMNTTNLNLQLQYGYQVHQYVNVGAYLGAGYEGTTPLNNDGKEINTAKSLFNLSFGVVSEVNFMGDFANSPYLGVAAGLTYRKNVDTPYLTTPGTAGTKVEFPKGFGFEVSPYLGYNLPLTALGATNVVFAPELGYKMTMQFGDDNKRTEKDGVIADSVMSHAVVLRLGFKLLF